MIVEDTIRKDGTKNLTVTGQMKATETEEKKTSNPLLSGGYLSVA